MPIRNYRLFEFPEANQPGRRDVQVLHAALKKLRIPVGDEEVRRGELGDATKDAIQEFQRRAELRVDGVIGPETVAGLQSEMAHAFFARSKTRTANLHEKLQRLGYELDAGEVKTRLYGVSTEKALGDFQKKRRLPADGRMSPELFDKVEAAALDKRFTTKRQIGALQRKLLRAIRIAKLEVRIEPAELKKQELGPTTVAAIKAFQKKYGIKDSGKLDPETFERLESVAASRPSRKKMLKVKSPETLAAPKRPLRLNMVNGRVGDLQRSLAFLGHNVAKHEFDTHTFGATTRRAVLAFQRSRGLPVTGHLEGATLKAISRAVVSANPNAAIAEGGYRVRGSLRDDLWRGRSGLRVQVLEKTLSGVPTVLAERKTLANGFYDVPYEPPRNPVDGQVKKPFHLLVRVLDGGGQIVDTKALFNPTPISWRNFTEGNDPYRGKSEYERLMGAVTPVLAGKALKDVEESQAKQEITHLALSSGVATESVMRLVLVHQAAAALADAATGPDALYAFVGQNLPPGLPSDLIGSTEDWTVIDALVERTVRGIVFMEAELQESTLETAAQQNLIPIGTVRNKAQALAALAAKRQTFALEKPILVGNGSLKQVLDASAVANANYSKVADALLKYGGMGSDFWSDVKARAAEFGGDAAVADLEVAAQLGEITKHHTPTLAFTKAALADPAQPSLNKPSDLAKLSTGEWRALIDAAGGQVPAGIEGNTADEKKDACAASLAAQSERLFPAIALATEADRGGQHGLTKLADVRTLLDAHTDLDLAKDNVHKFFKDKGVAVPADVLGELKLMQRVHRLGPSAKVGRALLQEKLHHSAAIVFRGRERITKQLAARGVDERAALTSFGRAEFQYAQILARLVEFRFELHRADPKAIVNHIYTKKEQEDALGDLPNLEALFGANDFCDCKHCLSVYGPAAYLADILRFLDARDAEEPNKTVRDMLFDRRPDIANIKLNCENTNTPLPYVDLVCEILEGAVPAPNKAQNFAFQSTWKPGELRAFPEHVRKEVYDKLRKTSFPMDASFDLWQEEARVWLEHLGVPRYELMKLLQARQTGGGARTPSDASTAGEYFGISSHEVSVITQASATQAAQQGFWGFDPTRVKIGVREFLDHCRLDKAELEYRRLLELMQVRWVNANGAPADLAIERPASSCDLDLQSVINVTVARLDRIHRFLRLWRRTGWEMWQLDLLIRAPRIGNGDIDSTTLERLHGFKRIQRAWALPFEHALALFYELNTENRTELDDPSKPIIPLYPRLFQNRAVSDPVDAGLALPLDETKDLDDHRVALLASLGVTDGDLTRLIARTDGKLRLANLSLIHNYWAAARALNLTVERLLQLQDLAAVADLFASPKVMLDFVELHERIRASGLQIDELDFLLNLRPESPHGLRDESVVRMLEGVREALRAASEDAAERAGQIVEKVAALFAIPLERARLLLEKLTADAALLTVLDGQRQKLLERDPADAAKFRFKLTAAEFPKLFEALRLLHKAVLLLGRQSVSAIEDLTWLLDNHATFGVLGLSELPVRAAPLGSLIQKWVAFTKWRELLARFPEPEGASVRGVLDLAAVVDGGGAPQTPIADVRSALHTLTKWPVTDLEALHATLQFKYDAAANDYTSIETYCRMGKAMAAVKRLGVSAEAAGRWALRDVDTANADGRTMQEVTAQQTRDAAKSKYDYPVWLDRGAPLQDVIREKKRTALTRYLVEHSLRTEAPTIQVAGKDWRNPEYWEDENDLLRYFLIDVEMSACQTSSRIKQAISSTQMFVHRCFLNLEQPRVEVSRQEREDTVSLNAWPQWRYMKSYRVWEAARKVFLYPENWIEPELRDDKTPFFKEFEEELLQGELTAEHAETAFRNYLEKLHAVSTLEVVAAYHQIDDDNPHDDLPATVDLFHVVARTRSEPTVYYYRAHDLNRSSWSGWEPIDADIRGDHITLAVYNRRLYMFWLSFHEKPIDAEKQPPAKASDGPEDIPKTSKVLEVRLSWSERKSKGWTAENLAREKLVHPWARPLFSYHLKPRYKSRENQLWLDIYISTSREFNNTRFYDEFKGNRQYLSAFRFDETGRPWHSSSFVFDGEVVGVRMKPLRGHYYLTDASGGVSSTASLTTSHQYVRTRFGESGRSVSRLEGRYMIAPRLMLPEGMHYAYNWLASNEGNTATVTVLENGIGRTLARGGNAPFRLTFSQGEIQFDTAEYGAHPVLYQDRERAFFVLPQVETRTLGYSTVVHRRRYQFLPFYHPYTSLFLRELGRSGVEGLLNRKLQRFSHAHHPQNTFQFTADYLPVAPTSADETAERDRLDFSRYGAYASYNWEVFFHAPFMIACRLSQNRRFEDAMQWFHYIFDPTSVDSLESPQRFWVTKPFFDTNAEDYRKQRIENLLRDIGVNLDELRAWRNDPFNPHRIARHRPIAFQKAVVMRYIDNLIAWGDQLFRRDSMESINEATTLYVFAYELLGPRPVRVPGAARQERTYAELIADDDLDPLGNKSVPAILENLTEPPTQPTPADPNAEPLPLLDVLYFCIPPNDKLLEYWDRVEDRLFKIRNCMNIEGVVRQLPLFEPPIDPGLLVKAAAAGVDIGSVLSLADVDPGHYRFRLLLAKAVEFCGEVRALGDKLLSVLEKRDAEALALLRTGQETVLRKAMRQLRKYQVDEAQSSIEALEVAGQSAEIRRDYYSSRELMNDAEKVMFALGIAAGALDLTAGVVQAVGGGVSALPNFTVGGAGFGGSPVATMTTGGGQASNVASAVAQALKIAAGALDRAGTLAGQFGSYQRRKDDWGLQENLAEKEVSQLERQIVAAELRKSVAERELENLELQIEQSEATEEYYKTKYTNEQLYAWMLQQITTVYFQAYKLAFDMAQRAEKALRLELGREDLSFVEFGYWDGLKKGLMAGEKLSRDIRRMEVAHLEQNQREFEVTKHFSLAKLMPLKLLELKTNGACAFDLPEWLFDMDYPGHFRRRIKSVSMTIPCVTGPYVGVHATVTLTGHGVRVSEDVAAGYGDPLAPDAPRFFSDLGRVPIKSIATSEAQNDGGVFELNFSDERYLPFEGAGAVSWWLISLPKESSGFEFDSITDVVLHMRYTAVAGNVPLTTAARAALAAVLPTSGVVLLDLKRSFGSEWQQFLHPAGGADQSLGFSLGYEHFPFFAYNKTVRMSGFDLLIESPHGTSLDIGLTPPGSPAPAPTEAAGPDPAFGNVHHVAKVGVADTIGLWQLRIKKDTAAAGDFRSLAPDDVQNAYLVLHYTVA